MAKTYELYLDESGDFEKFSRDEHRDQQKIPIRLIGGVLVPPELKDKENEHIGGLDPILKKYFPDRQKITHIHLSEEGLTSENRSALREEMINYFNKNMTEAKIVFIYEVEELLEEDLTPGAWIYRNMLLNLLKTLIFYHPYFSKDDHIDVKLAKRRYSYPEAMDKELASQGYLKIKDGDKKTWYTAVTAAELKTIIDLERKSLRFKTDRQASFKVKPFTQWESPFMAMADAVCNKLFHLSISSVQGGLERLQDNLQKTFGKDRILFFCRSDYDFPINALESFYQSKWGEFLVKVLGRLPLNISDDLLLIPALHKAWRNLISAGTPQDVRNVMQLAHNFLLDKSFHKLPLVKDILVNVERRLAPLLLDPNWIGVSYLYSDVALRYHNHHGNVVEAVKHRDLGQTIFQKFPQKDIHSVRSHYEFLNRASVADTNEFAFERAIALLEPIRAIEEEFTAKMNSFGSITNEVLGKIYGSLAQNYAFLGQTDKAEEYFKQAANHLGWNNFVQASYRAHLYLDMGDERQYLSEICRLFKKDSFEGFHALIQECLNKLPESPFDFNLHLLLKGMLVFPNLLKGQQNLPELISGAIQHMLEHYKDRHPWELVFITLGRLLKEVRKVEEAKRCWKAASEFSTNPENLTLTMIGHSARAWKALLHLEQNQKDEAFECMRPIYGEFERLKNENEAIGIYKPKKIPDKYGKIRAGWFDAIGNRFLTEFQGADCETLKTMAKDFISRFTFNYW